MEHGEHGKRGSAAAAFMCEIHCVFVQVNVCITIMNSLHVRVWQLHKI